MHRAALVGLIVLTGCQHAHLRHNTVHQAETLSDVYEQQVLDNLARTVHDAHAIPFFAYPNEGTTSITGSANLSASPLQQIEDVLGLTLNRSGTGQWGLTPVSDPGKLQLMQCAYQRSVYGSPLDKCAECCDLENKFEGRTAKKIKVLEHKICKSDKGNDSKEVPVSCDPETGQPYAVTYLGGDNYQYSHSDSQTYKVATDGYVTIPLDCDGPCPITCGWLHYGKRCDLPRDCCGLVGHHCGTYVWIDKCYRQHLSQLTLKILDYAVNDAVVVASREKKVKIKVDRFGQLTEDDKLAVGTVTATIGIDDEINSVLVLDKCGLDAFSNGSNTDKGDPSKADNERVSSAIKELNTAMKANPEDPKQAQTIFRKVINEEVKATIEARLGPSQSATSEPSKLIYPKTRTVRPTDYSTSPIGIRRGQRALGPE